MSKIALNQVSCCALRRTVVEWLNRYRFPTIYPICRTGRLLHTSSAFLTRDLPNQARVVICGAGAMGNSVAYHLVKNGWTDVVVIDQGRIGGGISWRGCGIVGHFHSSSEGIVTKYTSKLYREFQESGHDIGFKATGAVNIARTKDRMISLRRLVDEVKVHHVECELIGPKEISSLHPFLRTDDLEGGVWVASDAIVHPLAVCLALAKLAQLGGAQIFEGCQVLKIWTEGSKVSSIETNQGTIKCEYFVLCSGMWSRELGQKCVPKFRVPIHTAANAYIVTEPLSAHDMKNPPPVLRDYDGGIYSREYEGGFLVGGFEQEGKPLFHDDMPPRFEFERLPVDWPHFQPLYDGAKHRMPVLSNLKVKDFVNGPDTFTPDCQWILGETAEVDNLFVAVGMIGNAVQSAGGLGKELANWIINGEPEAYLLPFDIRRFIDLHNNHKFLRERIKEAVGRRYALSHPLQNEYFTTRKLRCSPIYIAQDHAGAVFGERMGFERALYFDSSKSREERLCPPTPTFGKPPWFDCVREEYIACRERVGIIDMSSFIKFHVKSVGRQAVDFLQKLCSNDVDAPVGSIVSTGMHNEKGGYENDCLLLRQSDTCYFMISPTALQTRIRERMKHYLPVDGSVAITDVTSLYSVLNVVGPKSKELMIELTKTDMDLASFTCKKMNVAYASDVLVMGFNNTGEQGYSLYIPSEYAIHVYNRLMTVGKDFGIKDVGYYALRFLRIEKFIPFWGEELDSNTTPFEVGRGFKVKMQKSYFLGKTALQNQLSQGLYRRLIHFQLENFNVDEDLWPWGREPIYRNGKYVGMTTSSGFGFTLERMVCLGFVHNYDEKSGQPQLVTTDYVTKDASFEIEIAGQKFLAKPSLHPPQIPVVTSGMNISYRPQARIRT